MSSSEITPTAQKIDRLLKRIEDGDIKIPAFQRAFVWNQGQVIELLDSIINDFPIGSVLLWNSREVLPATRNIAGFPLPQRDAVYPVNYVLDGQQRLSSIYAVFSSHNEQDAGTAEYNPNTSIFDIYYDFSTRKFLVHDDIMDRQTCVSLKNFLNAPTFLREVSNLYPNHQDSAQELYSKFTNYEVPVVTIAQRRKEDVGLIFERINNTGTKLNMLDLMIAWTWAEDFHLKESIKSLLETLDEKNFSDIPEKVILQTISGIIQDTAKTKDILALDPRLVRGNFDNLTSALEKTIDFLSTELNCASRDFLPHVQQIVPLTKFFFLVSNPNPDQISVIKKWFWKTSFSRRYSAQTDDKMNADIAFMTAVSHGNFSGLQNYSHSVDGKILIGTQFSKSHPYLRALLLLLSQKEPLDLVTSAKVDVGESLSNYNRKEYHHVFPRAFLSRLEVPDEKVNSIVNFCFLPASSNKRISNKRPSQYVFELVPDNRYQEIMRSNLLPLNKDIYANDDFDRFLEERAALILSAVDDLATV